MTLVLALLASAPAFTAAHVLPSNYDRPAPLAPGLFFTIKGEHLGPEQGCEGHADTRQLEPLSAAVPMPLFVNRLIFPEELCGVRVWVGDKAAGLQWVQAGQINFKVPQDVPLQGTAPLRVEFGQVSSERVPMKLGLATAELLVDGAPTTTAPVWVKVVGPPGTFPEPRYPFRFGAADFGCYEVEVRLNGALLPRREPPLRPGGVLSGSLCGSMALPAPEPVRNRFPLHLRYRFRQAGTYQVRLSYHPEYPLGRAAIPVSEWMPMEIREGTEAGRLRWLAGLRPPEGTGPLVADYVPSLLGFPDDASLERLSPLLYHPDAMVRRFTAEGLGYWPAARAEEAARRVLQKRGPSDVVVDLCQKQLTAASVTPYLLSPDPVLLRGAVRGAQALLFWVKPEPAAAVREEVERALMAARGHVFSTADEQTRVDYVSVLGGVRNPKASLLLWEIAKAGGSMESQALIAITWRKDARDLPRLAARMAATDDRGTGSSLPYSLRTGYGEAALPYLESALRKSPHDAVRVSCARELILAGRAAGFAFAAEAIATNRPSKLELTQLVRDQVPALRTAGEDALLAWLKDHSR